MSACLPQQLKPYIRHQSNTYNGALFVCFEGPILPQWSSPAQQLRRARAGTPDLLHRLARSAQPFTLLLFLID